MKNGDMETFLCITYTHKVSDTESLPYTKGDVRVLLHVGHVTQEAQLNLSFSYQLT